MRPTDRAGGIEGGISNGALLVARVAMKPLATLNRPVLETVDVVTKESTVSFRERTDVTAVPAMGVVAETMTALVLASEALRKFGGDSLAEVVRNRDGFVASLGTTPSAAIGPRVERHDRRRVDRRRPCRRAMTERILLVGMMGAGKTTTGRLVAGKLGWEYLDSDAEVEKETGLTVPELFARDGEAAFRDGRGRGAPPGVRQHRCRSWSRWPAAPCCGRRTGPCCAPAAGSSGCGPGPRPWPRRVGDGAGVRSWATTPRPRCRSLEAVRRPLYAEVADDIIDVDDLSPEEVAARIVGTGGRTGAAGPVGGRRRNRARRCVRSRLRWAPAPTRS